MPGINRPCTHIIEPQGGTVVKGFRTFAAKFIKAMTHAVSFVTELFGKAAGIEMGPSFTVLMDQAAIGKFGPQLIIQVRQLVKGQIVENGRQEVVTVRWTAWNISIVECNLSKMKHHNRHI